MSKKMFVSIEYETITADEAIKWMPLELDMGYLIGSPIQGFLEEAKFGYNGLPQGCSRVIADRVSKLTEDGYAPDVYYLYASQVEKALDIIFEGKINEHAEEEYEGNFSFENNEFDIARDHLAGLVQVANFIFDKAFKYVFYVQEQVRFIFLVY
jgi:hypothetical protein